MCVHPAVLTLWTQTRSRFLTKASEADARALWVAGFEAERGGSSLKSQLLEGCRGGSLRDQGHLGLSDEMKSTLLGAFCH